MLDVLKLQAFKLLGTITIEYVEKKIKQFERRFNKKLKWATRNSLEKRGVSVKKVVDALADLPADDVPEHKHFLESQLKSLYQTNDLTELFGSLNYNMNYLSYHLVEHLILEFDLEIKSEMEAYKENLRQFRQKTPLKLFCETQTWRKPELPDHFKEIVGEFQWPDDVTLEVVEQFRQEYACHYKLRECAMMVAEIRPCSFIITWYIPESVVEKVKTRTPKQLLNKYSATKLEIDGQCIFRSSKRKVWTTYN